MDIICWGHRVVVRESMASVFLRMVHDTLASPEGWGLVPLLHQDGVDLFLITPSTPLTITMPRGTV